jgi:hypothetical protein
MPGWEGMHAWGGCARLVGRGCTPREGARTPMEGGMNARWEGRARLGGGAHTSREACTRPPGSIIVPPRDIYEPQGA